MPRNIPNQVAGSSGHFPDSPFGRRVPSLDGIRGLAILSVIAFHTLRLTEPHGLADALWAGVQESTWAGVDLFFVLSGFLITGNLLDSLGNKHYLRNFYARRTLRIFPLYYSVLILPLLVVPLVVPVVRRPPLYQKLLENQIWLWTFLQNYIQSTAEHTLHGFGHFWSLAVEEQFYWVWPLIILFAGRRHLLKLCLAACVLSPLLRWALLSHDVTPWAIRQLTYTRADTLLYGAVAAILIREPHLASKLSPLIKAVLALAGSTLFIILLRHRYVPYEAPDTEIAGYSAVAILFAALIYKAATTRGYLTGFLSTPVLRWFGQYSYAIYIFHAFVLGVWEYTALNSWFKHWPFLGAMVLFVFTTAFSSLIALISWHLIESRFLRLKRYFEYTEQTTAIAVEAAETLA
jgi:peptidoglycan/LPS O-acetylase OafA/YrhL